MFLIFYALLIIIIIAASASPSSLHHLSSPHPLARSALLVLRL